jgi:cyclopropane fatty-acyl-phospholipid synthase-like methyltransferase
VSLFSRKDNAASARSDGERVPRHSSGWAQLLKHLKTKEGLRVLDIGPTSSTNINYITGLGHSIYMANLVEEASRPEWTRQETGEDPVFDVDAFLTQNLNFLGRTFDVVILWDVADYLPAASHARIIERLHEVVDPGGQILAFFHAKPTGPDTEFVRYHLTDTDMVEMQRYANFPLRQIFTNRQVESMFKEFSGYRFLLAKDALREVIITR